MPESFVTVGTYQRPIDAQLAKNRLEAEGIPVFLLGNEAMGTWFWHFGAAAGVARLQVPADLADQARAVLAARPGDLDAMVSPEEAFETDESCPECGSPLELDAPACPTCGMVRQEPFERSAPPPETPAPQATTVAVEEAAASPGDDLATRAYRAAVIGLLVLPPLMSLYSFWLLLRLAFCSGDVGSPGIRKAVIALVLDFAVFSVAFLVLRAILRF